MPDEMSLPGATKSTSWPFDNSYGRLPERFYARLAPTAVSAPRLVKLNRPLALQLGLDPDVLASPRGVDVLAGNRVPEGSDPIALAYAGHQFGNFVPQLGDGRPLLLGGCLAGRRRLRRRHPGYRRVGGHRAGGAASAMAVGLLDSGRAELLHPHAPEGVARQGCRHVDRHLGPGAGVLLDRPARPLRL